MTLHWLQERRRRKAAVDAEELAAELAWIQEVVDYVDREATNPVHIVHEPHVVPDADDGLRAFGAMGPGWLTRRGEPAYPLPEPEVPIEEPCDDRPRSFTGPDVADLIGKIARESTPCRPHGAHWAGHLDGDASADSDGAVAPAPPWLEGPDDGATGPAAVGDTGAPDEERAGLSYVAGEEEEDNARMPAAGDEEEVSVAAGAGAICDEETPAEATDRDAGGEAEGGASVILDRHAPAAAPGEPAASGRSTASLAPVSSCRRPASASRVCRTRQPERSPEDPLAALWALPATSPQRSF